MPTTTLRSGAAPRSAVPRRSVLTAGASVPLAAAGLAACTDGENPEPAEEPDLAAEVPRAEPGPIEGAGSLAVPFTARLLGAVNRSAVNVVCSPLSAQIALTMAGLGAAGDTRAQMEDVLGGTVEDLAQHANTLSAVLAGVGDEEREEPDEDAPEPPVASLVNGTWLQEGLEVEEAYLEGLATFFGSGVRTIDFEDDAAREEGREAINTWVADSTADLIEELVPEGVLRAVTRLVLVNALHLKAAWPQELTPVDGTFTTAAGEEVAVPMLSGITHRWYEDELCRATALNTYGDDLALAVVQPAADVGTVLDAWAQSAEDPAAGLGALLAGLSATGSTTQLTLPGVDIGWNAELNELLQGLGMTDAFTGEADFSGITEQIDLVISSVLQKAVLTVDQEGMEAAAATAVAVNAVSGVIGEHELVLDAPFLVVAFETSTLAPLVVGWVGDPTQTR
ncbi:serpin family protein [Brachybacterium sp. YJGR34]|uniref:serpin family protein n=1 Tax=Brachybacterium sp. YJGR34 TaxID=2059911 RepID=UPI000E09F555|nr:serpin family protein [Brachybacterium sp. YJGR34]